MAHSKPYVSRLLGNTSELSTRMLQPIYGYEKEPLLPLRKACEPLKKILNHELDRNITIALMNCQKPKDHLTQDESAAIHLYTMEWQKKENSLYFILNAQLRDERRSTLEPWYRFLKLLLTAFFKLPPCSNRSIWRGLKVDLSSSYREGKNYPTWSFLSCTASIGLLESPTYLGNAKNSTLLNIETSAGRAIRNHSHFEVEDEILLPPGRYLNVVSNYKRNDGFTIIQLRDVQAPYQLLVPPFPIKDLVFSPNEKPKDVHSSDPKPHPHPVKPNHAEVGKKIVKPPPPPHADKPEKVHICQIVQIFATIITV